MQTAAMQIVDRWQDLMHTHFLTDAVRLAPRELDAERLAAQDGGGAARHV